MTRRGVEFTINFPVVLTHIQLYKILHNSKFEALKMQRMAKWDEFASPLTHLWPSSLTSLTCWPVWLARELGGGIDVT